MFKVDFRQHATHKVNGYNTINNMTPAVDSRCLWHENWRVLQEVMVIVWDMTSVHKKHSHAFILTWTKFCTLIYLECLLSVMEPVKYL